MDKLPLVIELVFANPETFQNLDMKQAQKLLLTCKLASTNENIIKSGNKYKTWGMFSRVLHVLEKAVEKLVSSDGSNEAIRTYKELFTEAQNMIDVISDICVSNQALRQALAVMIMAEHKENLYEQMQDKAANDKIQLHTFCEHYFIERLDICKEMTQDMHNPHHDVFANRTYKFYTLEQNKNMSMIQIYHKWRKVCMTIMMNGGIHSMMIRMNQIIQMMNEDLL
jgi:hypothetical protein